jgi:hypothetical protein
MTDQEKQIRRLTLRVGVERFVTSNWRYLSLVRATFHWASNEEFDSVLAEMVCEGLLAKMPGREGGVKLGLAAQLKQEATNE